MERKKKRLANLPEDLQEYKTKAKLWFGGLFAPDREIYIARAPARLDVMGGIADYSGSVVLQGVLKQAALVGIQLRRDRRLLIKSVGIENEGYRSIANYDLDCFYENGAVKSLDNIRQDLCKDASVQWMAYVLGVYPVLLLEKNIEQFSNGATICIKSNIPIKAGLGSSSALIMATLLAMKQAYNLTLDAFQLARYCQKVENHIIGVPCGIIAPLASAMGKNNKLLVIRCQPHELLKMITLPADIQFIGINSRIKPADNGMNYIHTRTAAFMGRQILTAHLQEQGVSNPFNGYLCNLTEEKWREQYQNLLPEQITGRKFIKEYSSHNDALTVIDPEKTYYPQSRTAFPVFENARVQKFIKKIEVYSQTGNRAALVEAGDLMYESHAAYNELANLGTKETDLLVTLVKKLGPQNGLYGARISANGGGGTVVILSDSNNEDTIRNITSQYYDQTGLKPDIFVDSSPGGLELGAETIRFD